jgi:hypothetical protein
MGIVTDGLIGYWHYQQGVSGSTWENIAPDTIGSYDGLINGSVLQRDGMYFDGVDDSIVVSKIENVINNNVYELESFIKIPSNTATSVNTLAIAGHVFFDMSTFSQSGWFFGIIADELSIASINGVFPYNIPLHTDIKVNYVLDISKNKESIYINNIFVGEVSSGNVSLVPIISSDFAIGASLINGAVNNNSCFEGYVKSLKIYNRNLTTQEREQNSLPSSEVGLEDDLPQEPTSPIVTIISKTKEKISTLEGMSISLVTFKFDKDVVEYKVNVLGTSHDTGYTGIHDTTGVSADEEIQIVILDDYLVQEGLNRVNIYGKDIEGNWTPYEE